MSVTITCEECNRNIDVDDVICRHCYDSSMDKLNKEIDRLADEVSDLKSQLEYARSEIEAYEWAYG